MTIVICEKFNVKKSSYGQYRKSVLDKINKACPKISDIPIVGPQNKEDLNWMLVELKSGDAKLVLAICTDTLYLYAFRKGSLWDDGHDDPKWIRTKGETVDLPGDNGIDYLPFTGNYCHIGEPHNVFINRSHLHEVVNILYGCNDFSHPPAGAEHYFLLLVVVFCAGLRLIALYRIVHDGLQRKGSYVSPVDSDREKHWRLASGKYLDMYFLGDNVPKVFPGYGEISTDCVKENISVLLCSTKGNYVLPPSDGWERVIRPRRRDKEKKEDADDFSGNTSFQSGSSRKRNAGGSGSSSKTVTDVKSRRNMTWDLWMNQLVDVRKAIEKWASSYGISGDLKSLCEGTIVKGYMLSEVSCFAREKKFSTSVPDSLKSPNVRWNTLVDATVDLNYLIKCLTAATEASYNFWTGALKRVLRLLLLQNAGLKFKDTSAQCLAINLLGNVAARLKRDAVTWSHNKFWTLEVLDAKNTNQVNHKRACNACQSCTGMNVSCSTCGRCFQWDCISIVSHENYLGNNWSCYLCLSKGQFWVLQSYHKLQGTAGEKRKGKAISGDTVTRFEAAQQILLSYLQEAGQQDDDNLFTGWFSLCMWYKDDPQSQKKIICHLSRLKAKEILQDPGGSLILSRESARKIYLALGQNNSLSRGFDKVLTLLLTSGLVEADPEVLSDKSVQAAVEGQFCHSVISVREAALKLVGQHISFHPDFGLQYFEQAAERIKDVGMSVHKRAIKIICELITSNPDFTGTSNPFFEIISNDDELSVQDSVCKTFYEFWFEEPSGSDKHFVPMEVANETEQIAKMLLLMPNHQPLITIVKCNLALDFLPQSAKATGANHAALASILKWCDHICKHLLERILQVIGVEHVLALHVEPTLCVPATDQSQFVVALQPYLKNLVDDKALAKFLETIIFVIDTILPLIRKPQQSLIVELEQDLKHMIVHHYFLNVVHAYISCLSSLRKTTTRCAKQVDYLVHVFYKHLRGPNSDSNH